MLKGLNETLTVGVVYTPPIVSPYYKDDTCDVIEREVRQCAVLGKPILLPGDTNARTSSLPDYSAVDLDNDMLTEIENELI